MSGRRTGPAAERFGRLLAARTDSARLMRGLELAERGRVTDLELIRGRASAVATGSRADPYWVELRLPPAGELPDRPGALVFSCSCPDWGDPCKHGVALAMIVGDALDRDPTAAERLLGTPPRRREAERPMSRPRRSAGPTETPSWAAEVELVAPPANAEQFFGAANTRLPRPLLDGDPTERLRELGPLKVNGVDLAPHLIELARRVAGR